MPHFLLTEPLQFADALELARYDVNEEMVKAELFYLGDHYQSGKEYIGPKPQLLTPGKPNIDNTMLAHKIKELFTSKNVIAEVVNRQAGALLTEAASVSFDLVEDRELVPDPSLLMKPDKPAKTPNGTGQDQPIAEDVPLVRRPFTPGEQKIISEADRAFAAFAEATNLAEVWQTFLERTFTTGKAVLRVYVPERYRAVVEAGKDRSLVKVARMLRVECPKIKSSTVISDSSSGFDISITVLEQMSLASLKKSGQVKETVEIGYVDDAERTFIRVLSAGQTFNASGQTTEDAGGAAQDAASVTAEQSSALDLEGLLLARQLKTAPLINEQVMSLNRLVNLGLTMSAHVAIETGHAEMALLNVELEKEQVMDTATGKMVERPARILRGGTVTHNFLGVVNRGKDGSIERATPNIVYKEPSPIDTHVGLVEMAYRSVLEQVSQLHAAIMGDATASGESRRQALVDFIVTTHKARRKLDNMAEWLAKVILLFAANSTGQVEEIKKLRPIYRTQIYIGDLTGAERTTLLAELSKDVRSIRSVRERLGLDNDAEAAQIIKEALSRKATNERLGLTLQAEKAAGDENKSGKSDLNSNKKAGGGNGE